jgi:tRNA-intron endonuclease
MSFLMLLSPYSGMIDVQPYHAVYTEGQAVIPTLNEADSLNNDGYGSRRMDRLLVLEPYETLYLVEKERIIVVDEKNQRTLSFQELLAQFSENDLLVWTNYVTYRDLRSRGFVAKQGKNSHDHFLVYERGTYGKTPPNFYIHIVYEGATETVGHLQDVLEKVKNESMILKLAVIDRRNEVVYYTLSDVNFKELVSEEIK